MQETIQEAIKKCFYCKHPDLHAETPKCHKRNHSFCDHEKWEYHQSGIVQPSWKMCKSCGLVVSLL